MGQMKRQPPSTPGWVAPVTLQGRLVRLEPLDGRHLEGLISAGADREIWRWMPGEADTSERMREGLAVALAAASDATQRPFATLELATGRVVGSTRYLAIESQHRRVEIGATWLAPSARGRGLNDEAKLLLLRHAFETLRCQPSSSGPMPATSVRAAPS